MTVSSVIPWKELLSQIQALASHGADAHVIRGLTQFYESYRGALQGLPKEWYETREAKKLSEALSIYYKLTTQEAQTPTPFSHFHEKETKPFDYFEFGLDLIRPLVQTPGSCVLGEENITSIDAALASGDNVILLANHQAEIDPQIISILTEPFSRKISEDIICVAGHRVTQDPLAIPFSRGRNLICIYSKKYIEHPPERKEEKLLHNGRAMAALEEVLGRGGACIYVAPSGGRDRITPDGLSPAPFDPQSIEMFRLLSKKCGIPSHFHPLALHTIDLLPPPAGINISLGEARTVQRARAGLFFGPSLDITAIDQSIEKLLLEQEERLPAQMKQERRQRRADLIHQQVEALYQTLIKEIFQHDTAR